MTKPLDEWRCDPHATSGHSQLIPTKGMIEFAFYKYLI